MYQRQIESILLALKWAEDMPEDCKITVITVRDPEDFDGNVLGHVSFDDYGTPTFKDV